MNGAKLMRAALLPAAMMSLTATPASGAGAAPDLFQPLFATIVKALGTVVVMGLAVLVFKHLLAGLERSSAKPERKPRSRPIEPSASSRLRREPSLSVRPQDVAPPEPAQAPDALSMLPLRASPAAPASPAPVIAAWSMDLLRELEWKRFEELCVGFWRRKGYPVRLTGPGADGGIDLLIAHRGDPTRAFIIGQCKAWNSRSVGVEAVRALWGAKDHFKAELAIFYSVSGFTPDAAAFAAGKRLKLVSGYALLDQIKAMNAADQSALLAEITHGDYRTPTCPKCDVKMQRHAGRNGRPDFWGCKNFRRCGTQPTACRTS